ncbi:hypothetical protein AAH991_29805 [Microbispora sp. ZYX-F-249]|uniref:Uncharacterized protein n=1 Tax=Microbispora maris TaxID=3144104 RepID=A0ABV0AZ53_9ACTN
MADMNVLFQHGLDADSLARIRWLTQCRNVAIEAGGRVPSVLRAGPLPDSLNQRQESSHGRTGTHGPVDEFLRGALDHAYPGQWDNPMPFVASLVADGVGIAVFYLGEYIHICAGVLESLRLTGDLVGVLGEVNEATAIGSFQLRRGADEEHWWIVYSFKLLKVWIDPESTASAQMLVDVVSNMPSLIKARIDHMTGKGIPANRCTTDGPWWLVLM